MPSLTGSFSGKITKQFALPASDQPNHEISIAEVSGSQKSPDPLWNNSKITYWGFTDLINGNGTQRGYYNNVHPDNARDFGTFEARITTAAGVTTLEGTWKLVGGDGPYRGATGTGTFKTTLKSDTDLECNWAGSYEIAKAQAG